MVWLSILTPARSIPKEILDDWRTGNARTTVKKSYQQQFAVLHSHTSRSISLNGCRPSQIEMMFFFRLTTYGIGSCYEIFLYFFNLHSITRNVIAILVARATTSFTELFYGGKIILNSIIFGLFPPVIYKHHRKKNKSSTKQSRVVLNMCKKRKTCAISRAQHFPKSSGRWLAPTPSLSLSLDLYLRNVEIEKCAPLNGRIRKTTTRSDGFGERKR